MATFDPRPRSSHVLILDMSTTGAAAAVIRPAKAVTARAFQQTLAAVILARFTCNGKKHMATLLTLILKEVAFTSAVPAYGPF